MTRQMSMKIVGPRDNRKFYNVSTSDLSNYGGGYVYFTYKTKFVHVLCGAYMYMWICEIKLKQKSRRGLSASQKLTHSRVFKRDQGRVVYILE